VHPSSYHEALLSWPAVEVRATSLAVAPAIAPRPKLLSVVDHCTLQSPIVDGDGWCLVKSHRRRH
jgi:hypothetical protein